MCIVCNIKLISLISNNGRELSPNFAYSISLLIKMQFNLEYCKNESYLLKQFWFTIAKVHHCEGSLIVCVTTVLLLMTMSSET